MKQTIKTMTTVFAGLALTLGLTFTSCKKGDTGPKGETGATGSQGQSGPQAKYYDMSMTFGPTANSDSYSLASTIFDGDDAVIVYWKDPQSNNWLTQIPYTWYASSTSVGITFKPEIASITLFIYTKRADGSTASPWVSSSTQNFRVVVIKAEQRVLNPNVNIYDYNSVKTMYNLKD